MQAKAFVNYYEHLGLHNSATIEEIEKAHRNQALKYHPDKNPTKEARDKFEEMQTAYEVLKDPTKKKAFDNILAAKLEDIKRYEKQSKQKRQMAEDLLRREEENARSKIKEQQKAYHTQYEARIARKQQIEELQTEARHHKKSTQHYTVLIKWRHKSKLLYTKENLKQIFIQYGRIDDVVPVDGKHRAYIMFTYKESVAKLLGDSEKFTDEFKFKAMKDVKVDESNSDGFISTAILNKIRMANEKRTFNTIKEETGEGVPIKKKKVEELLDPMDPEEFRRKEEEILRKLME